MQLSVTKIFGYKNLLNYYLRIIWLLILLFPALLLVENYFSKGYVYLVFAALFPLGIYSSWKGDWEPSLAIRSYLAILFLIVVYVYVSGFIGQEVWGGKDTRFAVTSELMVKFLLPFVLIPAFCRLQIGRSFILVSIIFAGFSIFGALIYNFAVHASRSNLFFGAPIIWGDLSLLIGLFAMIMARHEKEYAHRVLLFFVAAIGLVGSLYSGTRGGWIVLLTLPFFYVILFNGYRGSLKKVTLIALFLAVISVVAYFSIPWVGSRVDYAFQDIHNILSGNFSDSIGQRILMWLAAFKAFIASPVTGIGMGNFYAFKQELIAQGELPNYLIKYKHEHSMYMTIIGSLGIVGIILFGVFFLHLFKAFKHLLGSSDTFIWGEMGLVLLLSYLDFGLSESFLFTHIGAAAFFFWASLLLYMGYVAPHRSQCHA
ncbi:O-antigen ligase [Sulfurivirga caldicuralii]|uniref:O-antigen ligase n=1 Tax=Sulfurivirga caldicuralii TaxID=364032 RepID=A0A1N6DZQ1_9GAMM|nr:O-antigen ligase family protein [Sulfurivirga caldicuralii]SIN76177.1 O-antigen ligase [Sulfurivirga caldicuralii]